MTDAAAPKKMLFVSGSDRPESWVKALRQLRPGLEVIVWPTEDRLDGIAYALVWKPPPGLLARLPDLQVIFSLGAGVDALVADSTLPNVPLVRMVEEGLTEGMTEYVVLNVLRHHRQLDQYQAQQRRKVWHEVLPQKLAHERRVGVMGLGVLVADAARTLGALRFDVAGWSRSPKEIPGVACYAGFDSLAEFLAQTEILVCLLPLTPDTRGILNAENFSRLPRGAVVINAARGGHLVESDLLAALDKGEIAAATLDVFETEPLPADHPFWMHPSVTVTPHVAAATHARSAAASVATQIDRFERGLPLEHVVDLRRGY